jgi:hypothetical protein
MYPLSNPIRLLLLLLLLQGTLLGDGVVEVSV